MRKSSHSTKANSLERGTHPSIVEEEQVAENSELISLPEESITFQTSEAKIVLPSQRPIDSRALFAAFLAFLAASGGIYVGLDYLDGDGGMYTHRQFIYAQSSGAPDGSATLTGQLLNESGAPVVNHTVATIVESQGKIQYATTDENGRFIMEKLDPGVAILDIYSPDLERLMVNRILLSPPALFEPIGFTHLSLEWPSEAEFSASAEADPDGNAWIDYTHSQKENSTEPYDLTAGAMYDMFGMAFISLGVISMMIAGLGIQRKSPGLIRISAITSFFSMGHLYVSCGLGFFAILLTMFIRSED